MAGKPKGPTPCDILIVGEAFGKDEELMGVPFIGPAGQELNRQLKQAGFDPAACRFTNVFLARPAENKIDNFCGKRSDVPKAYPLPPLAQGKYVLSEHLHHLDALADEIRRTNPRLIVALGNVPCWALLRRTGITKLRGSLFPCELVKGAAPVLPTFHPANILRDWSNRVLAVHDLSRAHRYLTEGFSPPRRELWLEPTLEEVGRFCAEFILDNPPPILSFDIETYGESITCIGFSPSVDRAITIPFFDPAKPDRNYWATEAEEISAWKTVRRVLLSDIPKLGQNGLYDIQYLVRAGIPVRRYLHDTMIRHHSLHPELDKGLGFMATLYTDEAPWKVVRDRNKDNFKIDDE